MLPTLLRLALPNVLVMLAQSLTGLIEAAFVGPLAAAVLRMAVAVGGGWLALRLTGSLTLVYLALGAGLLAMGVVNVAAVAAGAWFKKGAA